MIEFPEDAMYYRWNSTGFMQVFVNGARQERVHVFSTRYLNTRAGQAMVHDHRFFFDSTILMGTLRWVEYAVESNKDGPYRLWNSGREDLGLVRVTRIGEHTKRAGETYSFGGPDRYHEILPSTEDTMTYVVETGGGPYKNRFVLLDGQRLERQETKRLGPSQTEMQTEMNRLRSLL